MSSALEGIKSIDLEEWLTLATAPAPTKLKQGQTPDMKNVWVDEKPGSVITSNGLVKVGTTPSNNPSPFCINYFKTSSGSQTFVVSDNETVWTTVDFQNFTSIITGLSSSFQLRGKVIRDKLWLTNGSDPVHVFDGSTVETLDGTAATVVIQDITYSSVGTAYSPTSITIAYTTGGTAGSEVVTVTGPTISVQIQSGVSTATQVRAAVLASAPAIALVSPAITGTAGDAQVAASAVALSGGTPNAPRGRYIEYHDERVWLYHISSNRSAVYFSALSDAAANIIQPDDPAAWNTTDNFLQISEGDADFGTGMIVYRGYLHFFKQYSIWRLVGYDEYTYSRVKTRASTGTRFNESLQILDSLVHLIGVDGIYVFDGEESERISDIIDPATASQTAFSFSQLQQPNTNNQFWEVIDSTEWNAGTVPTNILINDQASFLPADSTTADFQAGTTQTNLDLTTIVDEIQLSHTSSGASSLNLALNQSVSATQDAGVLQIGNPAFLTDGDTTNAFGFSGSLDGHVVITNLYTLPVTTIILKGLIPGASSGGIRLRQSLAGATLDIVSTSYGTSIGSGAIQFPSSTSPTDVTITFLVYSGPQISIDMRSSSGMTMTEFQVFATAYNATGAFVSKALDYTLTPNSYGNFNVDDELPAGTTAVYFTQSSADGITWDPLVQVLDGAAIGSTLRRYLRWGVDFTSTGLNTPVVFAAYLAAEYISPIHNTGGDIFAWGPLESVPSYLGQTINFYYRTATTSLGVSSATWNLIVPGGVLSDPVANQWVQFKFEILSGDGTHLPIVPSVTINWVVGNGIQAQTSQNVASAYWRNRYWLSAAGPGAVANDVIVVRGKKTFGSPWMLKNFQLASFTRFQDNLFGCSSVDGSIYTVDTGYSIATTAMDSYFQTGDFVFGGFTANLIELDIEVERLGSWDLSVGVSVDGGNTFDDYDVDLSTSTYDANYITKINLSYTTTRFRLRFRTNGVDMPFQVHRCVAFYRLNVERGSIIGDYLPA